MEARKRKARPGRKESLRKGDVLFFSGEGRLIIEKTGANGGAVVAVLRGPAGTEFKKVKGRRTKT